MRREAIVAAAVIPSILLLAAGVVWAGGQGGARLGGVPVLGFCALLAFVIQWLAFIPAYAMQTERFYDLTGSLSYLTVLGCALALRGDVDARALLVTGMVSVWALRLGSFLFVRVRRDGFDRRFVRMKTLFSQFLMTWTLQGAWVFLALAAALTAITSLERAPIGPWAIAGLAVWECGFAIEVVADRQKQAFRAFDSNRDAFICSGLWARSRHPNYFGEIVLWIGVTIVAIPVLSGWQWATAVISPLFVILLLTRISGVRMLEARADRKWADDADYQRYKAATPVLVPRPVPVGR